MSSALNSLLGEDGAVSDSDQAFELPGLLLAAVLGRLIARAVEGLDFPVVGRDPGLLPAAPDTGLLLPVVGRLPVAPDIGRLLLLGGRLTTGGPDEGRELGGTP